MGPSAAGVTANDLVGRADTLTGAEGYLGRAAPGWLVSWLVGGCNGRLLVEFDEQGMMKGKRGVVTSNNQNDISHSSKAGVRM